MNSSYLQRLRTRRNFLDLKRQIVLGLVGGWLLGVLAWFRYCYVLKASNASCWVLGGLAAVLFALGLVWPRGLRPLERGIRTGTGWIGKGVFTVFLATAYFLIVTPVGLLWRLLRGARPFYAWTETAPANMEGWVPKIVMEDRRLASRSATRRPLVTQPFVIIAYFFRYGHFALIPIVVFLLLAGLVLFFVKSSALAPFIYTLF